jgi:hypothetical protein
MNGASFSIDALLLQYGYDMIPPLDRPGAAAAAWLVVLLNGRIVGGLSVTLFHGSVFILSIVSLPSFLAPAMFLAFHGRLPCSVPAGKLWTTAVLSCCGSHGITATTTQPTIVAKLISKSLFPSDLL